MRTLFFALLLLAAGPAMACSCLMDDRTLEQRIDEADRVVVVRVVAAELKSDLGPEATHRERWGAETIEYRLQLVETMKGGGGALPRLSGLAGTGGGDCTVRLGIGEDLLLFVPAGEGELRFSLCNQPYERLDRFGRSALMLQSVREFVRDRTSIHDCENLVRGTSDESAIDCDARREEWMRQRREALNE